MLQGEAQVTLHMTNGTSHKARIQISGENVHEIVSSVGAEIETAMRNPFCRIEPKDINSIEIVIQSKQVKIS